MGLRREAAMRTPLAQRKPPAVAGQMTLPVGTGEAGRMDEARAAYHRNRDVPAHLAGPSGNTHPLLPTPTENGVFMRQHAIGKPREEGNDNDPAERTNYPNVPGQQVMGPPHNPQQFGELDRHGNVYHQASDREERFIYQKHGPFMGSTHESWWQEHSKPMNVSTAAAVHTMQHADETGTHSYIAGPMGEGMKPTSILIHRGIPWVADGHHRMQEARGRGEATFPARVINLDQMHASMPVEPKLKKKDAPKIVDHLVASHQVHPEVAPLYKEPFHGHNRLHKEEPDTHFHGQRDFGPSYGGLGAPAPKQDFTDHMNPAQHDWDRAPSRPAAKRAAKGETPVV